MFEFKTPVGNNDRQPATLTPSVQHYQSKQQRLMGTALLLLLGTLVFVLYRDRDFWFPDAQAVEDQPQPGTAVAASVPTSDHLSSRDRNKSHTHVVPAKEAEMPPSGATITATRTVLPPLEVEVVAGSAHRTVHPGSTSIQVDLERGSTPPVVPAKPAPVDAGESAARLTSNAAERVQVSAQTANVVTHSVKPAYPTLARQMQVQGSVILQALIGRDGLIEDLRVLSGPPILANAAKEAVRQWQFKPHYDGSQAVETQAKITVNFTISTN